MSNSSPAPVTNYPLTWFSSPQILGTSVATLLPVDATCKKLRFQNVGSSGNAAINLFGGTPVINAAGSYTLGPGAYLDLDATGQAITALSDSTAQLTFEFGNLSGINPIIPGIVNPLLARFASMPSVAYQSAIYNYVAALYAAGVWQQLGGLWVLAAPDAVSALLNWTGTTSGTVFGSGTFTRGQGWAGDGTTGYIDTGIVPKNTGKVSQNNYSIGVYTKSVSIQGPNHYDISANSLAIATNRTSTQIGVKANETTVDVVTVGGVGGFFANTRNVAGSHTSFQGVNAGASTATASTALGTINLYIGAENGSTVAQNFSAQQESIAFVGAYLTPTQIAAMQSATATYLAAVTGL